MHSLHRATSRHLPESFDRRTLLLAALACAGGAALSGCQTPAAPQAESNFPGAGRRHWVTFPAFRAERHFGSDSSLTWTLLNADGSRGRSEKVDIRVEPVASLLFLVTWQEAHKTTVVQVEDFARRVSFTNITRPNGTFLQSKGTFVELV